jgi:NAD(P)-dependent dehydrogenase (short-subunit alcohol dehydrogenase family)
MKKPHWTTNNIPNLTGKVIIVTGGNSGLGYESVKAFAEKGAEVILTARSMEKGEQAKAEIGETKGKIVVMQLDLASFESIRKFAKSFEKAYNSLDILLNNAGIMTTPYYLTEDGLEAQNGVNHFGHFMLTGLLFDLIKKTPGARIVNVSSNAHKQGKMDFNNYLFEEGKGYSPIKSYGRSKLANLLFTLELQDRFKANGIDVIAVSAHPGVAETNLARHLEGKLWFKLLLPVFKMISHSQAQGALPQIRAAVDPEVKGGEYFGPHKGMKGYPVVVKSNAASHNKEDAKRLWELSEQLTGVTFKF